MLFAKSKPLEILTCNTCAGTGRAGFFGCRTCRGMGMGVHHGKLFYYFAHSITRYHVAERKGRRWLNRFEVIGAVSLALSFLFIFVWNIYKNDLFDLLVSESLWMGTYKFVPFFWFGIIALSFLLYKVMSIDVRGSRLGEWEDLFSDEAGVEEEPFVNWKDVFSFSRRRRHNISNIFNSEAVRALEDASTVCVKLGIPEISAESIFSVLLQSSSIQGVFIRLGISNARVREAAKKLLIKEKKISNPIIGEDVRQIVFRSFEYARTAKQDWVGATELLLSAVQQSEHLQEILFDLNVDETKLANVLEWVRIRERLRRQYTIVRRAGVHRSKHGMDRAMTAVATPYLNNYSQDLTLAAKYGQLHACVAREKETEELYRIIEGGRQNIILVGEHGVGKMSIVEGLAQNMLADHVPARLHDKRLVQLSASGLLAGTTVSGAQERLIRMMNEVSRAKNIILFINNVHDLMSKGGAGGEGMDVSETLAEYASDGRMLVIATTTPDGYNRHVAASQMSTIFARLEVNEMNTNQAIQVLESRVGVIEYKQKVFFSYGSLDKAVTLAKRYLHDRHLPESAIEIMTEAAAYVHSHRGADQLVTEEDAATVVAQKTGIPVTAVSDDESQKLIRLEEEMHKKVVGQFEAVTLVASALRRARTEIRSTKKPIASFLFLGPTGVGKTELAKTIAEVYFGGENQMVRVDMSEFQDKQAIYRLIGLPGQPGTGILTEAVRQRPFSLILFDEMEKADPDVLNLFLQVFDDGRLTDSVGRVIDFTNTIIISTSNAGTAYAQERLSSGVPLEDVRQELIRGELKKNYRPEFLNRFDGIVLFTPLDRSAVKEIAKIMLVRVSKDLEMHGVELRVEEAALEAMADIGFDPEFGARPMRRAIQDKVENALADMILQKKLDRRDVVVLGEGAEMRIEKKS